MNTEEMLHCVDQEGMDYITEFRVLLSLLKHKAEELKAGETLDVPKPMLENIVESGLNVLAVLKSHDERIFKAMKPLIEHILRDGKVGG